MRSFGVGSGIFSVDFGCKWTIFGRFWVSRYHISTNKKNNLYKKIRNNFQCYYLHDEEIISSLYFTIVLYYMCISIKDFFPIKRLEKENFRSRFFFQKGDF